MNTFEPAITPNAKSVLGARYLIRDLKGEVVELPRQMFERVAAAIAQAEKPEDRERYGQIFFDMMAHGEFLPNTPCLVNAGRPDGTGQLSACFVIPVPDSMEGIFEAVKQMAMIHKTGGGTGFSFSRLRPAGDRVKSTSGLASGPCSFMQVFDNATEHIKQGGVRRGANMGILRVDHPDILRFIKLKLDRSLMQNFNVSVAITDEFMIALEHRSNYYLRHPTTRTPVGELNSVDVWNEIVRCAWEIGDPGLWFIDRTNELDPLTDALGPVEATNPCQPAWATVLTPDGIRTLATVDVGSMIWSGKRWTKITKKVATGIKPVFAYRTRGGTFYGTENHRVVQSGSKIEARAAEGIDIAVGSLSQTSLVKLSSNDVIAGLVTGDGMYHKASGRVFLIAGPDEIDEYRNDDLLSKEIGEYRPGVNAAAYEVINCPFDTLPVTYEREVSNNYLFGTESTMRGFLRGLYTANGSVVANRVTLKAASFKVIEAVQQMLSALGIPSYYTVNKAHDVEHHNGVYTSRESYDLNIGNVDARRRFALLIGFVHKHKTDRLMASLEVNSSRPPKSTYDVVDIEMIGDESVYDITVEADEHTYWTGGLLVSNCGEVPLRAHDACCLGSINVSRFYHENTNSIDMEYLEATAVQAVRFLDNMLSINQYPIPEIHAVTSASRKIGLGVMGWADLLVKLRKPYASVEARDLGSTMMRSINAKAIHASEGLAEERGTFGAWSGSKWNKLGHKPRRNSTVTVIAPTGSISIIAGCSSGIEPLFALSMTRDQAGLTMEEVHSLVQEIGKREGFWSFETEEIVRKTGSLATAANVPEHWRDVFRTANEIAVPDHVLMQAAFQDHVEDATSKTINLRKTATHQDVAEAYMLAWENGCKGITVFRDGCRGSQVLTAGTNGVKVDVAQQAKPERRKIPKNGHRQGQTISKPTSYGTVHVTINEHPTDNEPFEMFITVGKGGTEVNAWTEAFGRAVSYFLSMPSPITPRERLAEIAAQLGSIGGGGSVPSDGKMIASAPDAISRVILDYLSSSSPSSTNGEASHHRDICPQCGKSTLTYEQPCGICSSCGFSKC